MIFVRNIGSNKICKFNRRNNCYGRLFFGISGTASEGIIWQEVFVWELLGTGSEDIIGEVFVWELLEERIGET